MDTITKMEQEEQTPEAQEESPILSAARLYFMDLAKQSDKLRKQAAEAKTKPKRDYYTKKLRNNNKDALAVLARLSQFDQNKLMIEAAKKVQSEKQSEDASTVEQNTSDDIEVR